jgi:hypothetical protein
MSYKPRSLFGLIEDVNQRLFLPHIQRPFVWEEGQMRRLFDSLMRNYPIQTFLFWRTKDAIKARRFQDRVEWDADLHRFYEANKSRDGVEKVFVLDGQQRLQTLFALFNGTVESADGVGSLEAYFDVTAGHTVGEDGMLHDVRFASASPGPTFYRLRDLLGKDHQKNAEEIADELNEALDTTTGDQGEERKARHKLVRKNCGQLVSLLREDRHFWVEELDGVAQDYPYGKILDIFVRVNSGGTKLDAADLMFASMKEKWEEVEERVERTVEALNGNRLRFDKSFALKCLTVGHGKGAELGPEKFAATAGEALLTTIEENWDNAEGVFQQLRDFIEQELQLDADKVVRSYGAFVPLFDYLYHNPRPDPGNRVLMRGYYYKSQLFNWYASRTDGVINVVHGIVGKPLSAFPLDKIKEYFKTLKADTELRPEHLGDMRLRFIVLNLVYVDRFGRSPFNVMYNGNEPHVDHIYPQSPLRTQLKLPTAEINHIGNYRFLGATDNQRKRAELPASYFARLKQQGVNVENHLLLKPESDDPSLLKFDTPTYQRFRDERLKAVFAVAERIVNPELYRSASAP